MNLMVNKLVIIIFIALIEIIISPMIVLGECGTSTYYTTHSNEIFFTTVDDCSLKVENQKKLIGVDSESFYAINNEGRNNMIGRDQYNIYCKGKNIGKNKDAIIHLNILYQSRISIGDKLFSDCQILNGIDGSSYKIIFTSKLAIYAKDKNYVYYNDRIIVGADIITFQILDLNDTNLNYYISYDDRSVYFKGNILFGYAPYELDITLLKQFAAIKTNNENPFDQNGNNIIDLLEEIMCVKNY